MLAAEIIPSLQEGKPSNIHQELATSSANHSTACTGNKDDEKGKEEEEEEKDDDAISLLSTLILTMTMWRKHGPWISTVSREYYILAQG